MEKMQELIKCACPHECSEKCVFCKANYEFILNKPIQSKCGHCICQLCCSKLKERKDLKCIFCKSRNREVSIEIETSTAQQAFNDTFNAITEMSHDSCIKKLQSTLTFIEGKY
jgi:hypothetical protein